jgi:hypothetical protein
VGNRYRSRLRCPIPGEVIEVIQGDVEVGSLPLTSLAGNNNHDLNPVALSPVCARRRGRLARLQAATIRCSGRSG